MILYWACIFAASVLSAVIIAMNDNRPAT